MAPGTGLDGGRASGFLVAALLRSALRSFVTFFGGFFFVSFAFALVAVVALPFFASFIAFFFGSVFFGGSGVPSENRKRYQKPDTRA